MNGTVSAKNNFVDSIRGHLDLVSLEWQYEKKYGWRRIQAIGIGAILLLAAFVMVQLAALHALIDIGIPFERACLSLGAIYAIWGGLIVWRYGHHSRSQTR